MFVEKIGNDVPRFWGSMHFLWPPPQIIITVSLITASNKRTKEKTNKQTNYRTNNKASKKATSQKDFRNGSTLTMKLVDLFFLSLQNL